jgi:hypothetical protein
MSPSIIIDKDCDEIQAAMALSLLQFSRAHPELTYAKIGKAMEREKQSVGQYINNGTEMPASCWLKLTATWPELNDRFEYNLDEAEKAFRARQRELVLRVPVERDKAA